MIYLMSSEVGCDQQGIGFPSVKTCIAIVYATDQELIGWHTFNTLDETTVANAEAFCRFILANRTSHPVHLYAASSSSERGTGWEKLMVRIARRLAYEGPITLFDTQLMGGTYFEFLHTPTGATIHFKKNAKMQYPTMEVDNQTTPHRRIIKSPRSGLPRYKYLYGGENGRAVIHTAPVVTSNSGLLRPAPAQSLRTFRVKKNLFGTIKKV
jgi:hypothetical protein